MTSNHKQYLTWPHLEKINKDDSSIALCLSELVDNSINNFEENKSRFNEKLIINIIYEKNNKDKFYIVSDNANGIDNLDEAMNTYIKANEKDFTTKSNYGIGMKFAIFWLGKNGRIYTKNKNIENRKEIKGTYGTNSEGHVLNNIDISNDNMVKYDTGTTIVIDNVNSYRALDGQDMKKKIKELEKFLGYRFYKYLSKNSKLEIEMNIKVILDGQVHYEEIIKPYVVLSSNSNEIFSLSNNCNDKDEIEKFLNNSDNYHYIKSFKENLPDLYNLLKSGKPMIFDDFIDMKTNNEMGNIKIPIKLGILKNANIHLCGISIKQSNRYICHPSTNNSDSKLVKNFMWSDNTFLEGRWRWLVGDMDLEKIPGNESVKWIKPDKNKSGIIFELSDDNPFDLSKFKDALKKLVQKYDVVFRVMQDLINDKRNSANQTKIGYENSLNNKNLASKMTYNESLNQFWYDSNELNKILHLNLNNSNVNKKIKINLVEDSNSDKLIEMVSDNDSEIVYSFNICNEKLFGNSYDEFKVNTIALISYLETDRKYSENTLLNMTSIETIIDKIINSLNRG